MLTLHTRARSNVLMPRCESIVRRALRPLSSLIALFFVVHLVLAGGPASNSLICVYQQEVRATVNTISSQALSATGIPVPSMKNFDEVITDIMAKRSIPGGAVAVTKDGRLVLARGYGLADRELNQQVQPVSLFRIGSISKPITAVTILKLAEEGRLDLDAKAFRVLDLKPLANASVDQRIYDITIRQLLEHSGGWNFTLTRRDPMQGSRQIAEMIGVPPPLNSSMTIRFMLGIPLDFDPGKGFDYCNFGYCVLGRVIEKVTGQDYEGYVKSHILAPLGITRMKLGRTLYKDRAENEVHYYDYPGAPLVQCVYPDEGMVPAPYGAFCFETADSVGAWIASPVDLVRFVTALDGRRPPAFLKPETVRLMVARPAPPLWVGTTYGVYWGGDFYYALGWFVRPTGNDADWWHTGSIYGTSAILTRTYDGLAWAVAFNSMPKDIDRFRGELDRALRKAAREVTEWPTHDLFDQYGASSTATPAVMFSWILLSSIQAKYLRIRLHLQRTSGRSTSRVLGSR